MVKTHSLRQHNTLALEAKAERLLVPQSIGELLRYVSAENNPVLIGGGSNILLCEQHYYSRRSFILLRDVLTQAYCRGTQIIAGAGCDLMKLCVFAAQRRLGGLEGLWGIPGTIGGAIFMNAGAYGTSIHQIVSFVDYYDPDKDKVIRMPRNALESGYRESGFQGRSLIILRAALNLARTETRQICHEMAKTARKRHLSFPYGLPNAGSVFKRPPNGPSVGVMTERLGLKGYRIGEAAISTKHGGFIVNYGKASIKDVCKLVDLIRSAVLSVYGIELELEWQTIKI